MTVFNLTAQLNHPEAPTLYKDCFCYDEPSLGITAEPLIHITTAAIQKLLAPAQPQQIQLTFSTEHQSIRSQISQGWDHHQDLGSQPAHSYEQALRP